MLGYQVTSKIGLALPRPTLDGPQLFDLLAADRSAFTRYLPWVAGVKTAADEVAFLRRTNEHFGREESLNLVIVVDGTVAGMISYNQFDHANHSADIGYWLGTAFRGRGIMTQALASLCDLGFQDYGLNRLEIRAAVDNLASRAVAERAGFQAEGVLRQHEKLVDGYHDEQVYGYLRATWAGVKGL